MTVIMLLCQSDIFNVSNWQPYCVKVTAFSLKLTAFSVQLTAFSVTPTSQLCQTDSIYGQSDSYHTINTNYITNPIKFTKFMFHLLLISLTVYSTNQTNKFKRRIVNVNTINVRLLKSLSYDYHKFQNLTYEVLILLLINIKIYFHYRKMEDSIKNLNKKTHVVHFYF